MSEIELYQAEGLEDDMQQLRAMRRQIMELWIEVGSQRYATPQAEGVFHEARDMLNATSEHILHLTMRQAWAADPSTDTGQIEGTIQ
jgi:hypothetical protein